MSNSEIDNIIRDEIRRKIEGGYQTLTHYLEPIVLEDVKGNYAVCENCKEIRHLDDTSEEEYESHILNRKSIDVERGPNNYPKTITMQTFLCDECYKEKNKKVPSG